MFSRIATTAVILMTSTTAMAGWTTSLPDAEPTADTGDTTYDYGGFAYDLSEDEPVVLQAYDEIEMPGGIVYTIPETGHLTRNDVREWSISISESVFEMVGDTTRSNWEERGPEGSGRRVRSWGIGRTGARANYLARDSALMWCRYNVAFDSYPVRVQTAAHEVDSDGDHMKAIDWECTRGSDIEARGGAGWYDGTGNTRSAARKSAHDKAARVCDSAKAYPIWRGVAQSPTKNAQGVWEAAHLFNCSPARIYISASSNSGPTNVFPSTNPQQDYDVEVYGDNSPEPGYAF